ncbi:MAG: hypothetical protein ACRC31_01835 [Cetobacterium sp.]
MFNISPALPYDPTVTDLLGGQPLAFKTISGKLVLTKLTATNNQYAGAFYGSNGSNPITLAKVSEKIKYVSMGFFDVPCTGAVTAGVPLYLNTATGLFTATPGTPAVKVGIALSGCTGSATDNYVKAELIKVL